MTPSQIRCLLAVLALTDTYDKVESKNVAHLLGVRKSTVHSTLGGLMDRGFIHKEPYGNVHLTNEGKALARKLETRRDDIAMMFTRQYGLSPEESGKAAVLLMGELSEAGAALLQAAATRR